MTQLRIDMDALVVEFDELHVARTGSPIRTSRLYWMWLRP